MKLFTEISPGIDFEKNCILNKFSVNTLIQLCLYYNFMRSTVIKFVDSAHNVSGVHYCE